MQGGPESEGATAVPFSGCLSLSTVQPKTLTIGSGSTTTLPTATVPTIPTVTPTPGQLANTGTSRGTVLTAIGLTLLGLGTSMVIASRRRLART